MWRNRNSYLQVGSTVWTPHTAVSLSIVYKVEAEPAWLWDSFHEEWIRKETGSGLIKCCSWSCRNSKRLCHDSILVQDSWMTEPWMTLYFTKTRELALSLMRLPPSRCTLVGRPTRWSLLFTFGFLIWSSIFPKSNQQRNIVWCYATSPPSWTFTTSGPHIHYIWWWRTATNIMRLMPWLFNNFESLLLLNWSMQRKCSRGWQVAMFVHIVFHNHMLRMNEDFQLFTL